MRATWPGCGGSRVRVPDRHAHGAPGRGPGPFFFAISPAARLRRADSGLLRPPTASRRPGPGRFDPSGNPIRVPRRMKNGLVPPTPVFCPCNPLLYPSGHAPAILQDARHRQRLRRGRRHPVAPPERGADPAPRRSENGGRVRPGADGGPSRRRGLRPRGRDLQRRRVPGRAVRQRDALHGGVRP